MDKPSADTVLLALLIEPGRTAGQLAEQLGCVSYYRNRRQPYTYPVRAALKELEGRVRSEDVPGGPRGFRRLWYPVEHTVGLWYPA
jgi:hypothetical protein